MPEQMITIQYDYLRSNRGQFVNLVVAVNPETNGLPSTHTSWLDSPWHTSHLDAQHRNYLDGVVRWAEAYRQNVRADRPGCC